MSTLRCKERGLAGASGAMGGAYGAPLQPLQYLDLDLDEPPHVVTRKVASSNEATDGLFVDPEAARRLSQRWKACELLDPSSDHLA